MKLTYLPSNSGKVEEANMHFNDQYGFEIDSLNTDQQLTRMVYT